MELFDKKSEYYHHELIDVYYLSNGLYKSKKLDNAVLHHMIQYVDQMTFEKYILIPKFTLFNVKIVSIVHNHEVANVRIEISDKIRNYLNTYIDHINNRHNLNTSHCNNTIISTFCIADDVNINLPELKKLKDNNTSINVILKLNAVDVKNFNFSKYLSNYYSASNCKNSNIDAILVKILESHVFKDCILQRKKEDNMTIEV